MLNFSIITQLFKLVWNRKRSNALMVIELAAAFLVVFLLCLAGVHFSRVTRQPLGYDYQSVWRISISRKEDIAQKNRAVLMSQARQIVATLESLPEVESVCFATTTPFGLGQSNRSMKGTEDYRIELSTVDDNFASTMNLSLTQGRWFDASDDVYNGTTSTVKPVVLNEAAAMRIFGNGNPVGQDISREAPRMSDRMRILRASHSKFSDDDTKRYRVVGIVSDYRRGSEIEQTAPYMFYRFSLNDTTDWIPQNILVRMKNGIPASYEEIMLKALETNMSEWTYQITTLEKDRQQKKQMFTIPLTIAVIVAGFMLLMVALGLVGVVWQSVTRRMRELGVRRAFGAKAKDIHIFVIGELLALTTFAVLIGLFFIAQMPLIPFFEISTSTFVLSIGAAIVAMYILTMLCALYPSRTAVTVQPSEALRYE